MVKRLIATVAAVTAGVGVSNMDVWAAVGTTPGQFAVAPTGSAQYSIPLRVPPGPRGMQPNLSLAYSSQSGIGPLGVGWSIGGLGAVTRCNLTYAEDAAPAPVALTTADGYCLNGSRLRLTSGTYGTAGSTYQTEIADFSNVTMEGAAGNGPAYFTVQAKNGLTYYYGYTDANGNGANSEVIATGSTTALYWLLSKVTDRAGNNYVVNYTSLSGTSEVSKILWTPTSSGAATYTYSMVFNYTTNVPQSSITKYVSGTLVANTELLQSVAIYNGTSVIKDYFLGYQASTTTGREELITVLECADSAKSNCLLPTSIGYQAGGSGVSSTTTTALSSSGALLKARYDLNGDGYPDLVYTSSSGPCYVVFGSASGYGSPVAIGVCPILIGNLTGGNEDGILADVSGTWWYYTWNGTEFTGSSTGISYDTATYGYQLADINGDGLPDLIDLDVVYNKTSGFSTATVNTRLNTSSGSTVSFSSTVTAAYALGGLASAQLQTPDMQYGRLRRYDFNGDGRDDLALMVVAGKSPSFTQETLELLSAGTTFTATTIQSVSASGYSPVFFTNWNNDACTDFVTTAVQPNTLYISGCNGTVATTYSVGTVVAAMDWDGDGRTDLVVANGSTLGVYLSTGTAPGTLLTTSIAYASTCQYVTLDANGDGLDDLGCWSQSGSNPLTYNLHNGAFTPPDLAISFVDGFGNSVAPKYASISQPSTAYNAWNDQVFPYQNWIGPYYVAYLATFSDPSSAAGATYYQQYWYAGASMNLQGRGFAGFGAQQRYDSRSGIWETQNYNRAFPYTGMLNYDVAAQDNLNSQPISWRTNTLTYLTLNGTAYETRYFPYASATTVNSYEVGGTKNADLITSTVTSYSTPDSYGNFDTVTTTVTDKDSQSPASPNNGNTWTSSTVSTITPDASTWCLNLPSEVQVTRSSTATGGASITRTVNYTPDYTNCRETQKVIAPGTSYQVTEAYGFDGFGNVNSDAVTGTGMAARTATINWGTTGQFPTVIINPLTPAITLGYDSNTGKLTSQTDPNYTSANPLSTSWMYDPFGRKTQETRMDGTYTTWSYNDCATFGGCLFGSHALAVAHYLYASNGTLQSDGTTYFDTVHRPVMANQMMLSGGYNRIDTRYDSLGRVAQQSMPCTYAAVATTCTYWTTNSYDIVNRPTQSQRPISATDSTVQTTNFSYSGRTSTVKDALGNTTTKISLPTGSLARSQDPKGYYQNFTYDAFGSLTGVSDSASNTLFSAGYAYGAGAFQTSSTDMDLGARSYTVDPLGEVTAWTDAKNQSFSQTYDALSRPLVRTDNVASPDLTTTWTWGSTAASYNIGKLQSVTAVASNGTYAEAYSYDSLTRLQTDSISIPSDSIYTYTYAYNATTGLLNTLTYPTSTAGYSLKLEYGYTNGILQQVSDANSSTVFWQNNAMNPRGQITQETLGNGIVTNRAYDAVTGWISSIQSGTSGGSGAQNQSYLFDYMGDVTQRQDNNEGLTENFFYDADYRLDHSTLGGTLNLQMTYDGGSAGPGNITARSDVAGGSAWTYDPVRKHAVTQAGTGGYAYTYDANGNATSRNGYAITWSSYNYPISINGTDKNVTLYYGPNRQYYEQVYDSGATIATTIYAGGLLEKVTLGSLVDWRHYIRVGNELVAIMSRQSSGTNVTHYVLSDHEGSIAAITDGSAATTVNESFSAFGTRRNPSTWSGIPTCPDLCTIAGISREGFTGQDAIGGVSMGLNHMKGRVQDAITGRFLSPDPTVPNLGNTQSFNRYTYVNNNPVTMADPSGFTPKGTCNQYCPGDYYWSGAASGTNSGSALGSSDSGDDGFSDVFGPSSGDLISGAWGISPGSSLGSGSGNNAAATGDASSGTPASDGDSGSSDPTTGGSVATDTTGSGTSTTSSGVAQSQFSAPSQQVGFGSNADFAASSIDQISEIDVTAQAVSTSSDFQVVPASLGGVSTWTRLGSISHRALLLALIHRNPSLAGRLRADVAVRGGGFIDLLLDNKYAYELKPSWWQYGGNYLSALNQLAGYLSAGGYTAGTWSALGTGSSWVGVTGNFSAYGISYTGGFVYGYDQMNSASGLLFYITSPGSVTFTPNETGLDGGLQFGP